MADINARTRLLTGTPAEWAANDLVLGLGELVIERSGALVKFKAGDGASRYSALPFVTAVPDIPPEYLTQAEADAAYLALTNVSIAATPNAVPRLGANGMLASAMIPLPPAIDATAGLVDAGKLVKTATSGKLDLSFLPPIVGVSTGAADAGKLIKTAASGKIDPSLITITTGKYRGTADGTAPRPAGTYAAGDYFINSGNGLADASWGLPGGTVVVPNQQLYFNGTSWDVVGTGDTQVMLLPDGTAAMPGLGFLADQSTGIWRPAADALAVSIGGVERVRFQAPNATDAALLFGNRGSLLANAAGFTVSADAGALVLKTNAQDRLRFDTLGNVGFNVTPHVWGTLKAIEGSSGALAFNSTVATYLTQNLYFNGTSWIHSASDFGSAMLQNAGKFQFFVSPSKTAGSTAVLNQIMTLVGSGAAGDDAQLLLGTATTANAVAGRGVLEVSGASAALAAFDIAGVMKGYVYAQGSSLKIQTTAGFGLELGCGGTPAISVDVNNVATYGGTEIGWRNLPLTKVNVFTNISRTARGTCVRQAAQAGLGWAEQFKEGDVLSIYNYSGVPIGLIQGGGNSIYWGTPPVALATRTLANNALVTVTFIADGQGVLTGSGIS